MMSTLPLLNTKDIIYTPRGSTHNVLKTARAQITQQVSCDRSSVVLKIFGRFYLIASDSAGISSKRFVLVDVCDLRYDGFRDDFGPMDLEATLKFANRAQLKMTAHPSSDIAILVSTDRKELTNAVYLIGAYMVLQLDMDFDEIERRVCAPLRHHLLSYRDVSVGPATFLLHLRDCWGGLLRAKRLGWIRRSAAGFDNAEYNHYGNPLNGDIHEVVPGKLFAFRGPQPCPRASFGTTWRRPMAASATAT